MLKTERQAPADPRQQSQADAELAEVYGGRGIENLPSRAKWYCAGLWPFRRISFECPGCRRWLSVSRSHAGRVGFCPSCDLTVGAPEPAKQLPPALVSSASEIPALPARRLPVAKARGDATQGTISIAKTGQAPDLKRQVGVSEESEWGIHEDDSLVPIRVVTRLQSFWPWLGIAALLGIAWLACQGFMAMQGETEEAGIPLAQAAETGAKPPLSSELWVVLDSLSTAVTPEEILSLVRNPDEMRPILLDYYAKHDIDLPHRFERASPGLKVFVIGGKSFARFEGRCDGRPVKFSFEGTKYGWRLDWESLVGYSALDWSEFLSERPGGEHQFRLLVSVANDELLEYDRERFICLQLTDHLETGTGFALVDRYGKSGMMLGKFFKISDQARSGMPQTWITPSLRKFEGSGELLEVVDLESTSWLIP
ncbi:MAG: hypothetical protein ACR2RV_11615 [Verrucomicrobiales bacterium]